MARTDPLTLPPLPPGGVCRACGGRTRRSHSEYVRRGEEVAVHLCVGCGRAYRGAAGARGERAERRDAERRSRRPLPDEGPPANPVIDEEMARRLREQLGG